MSPPPALGQYPGGGGYPGASGWVPCDANGVPLPSGDDGISGDGGAILAISGKEPDISLDGTYAQLTDWWMEAYTPNSLQFGPQYPYWGLGLANNASNVVTTPDGYSQLGFFAPNGYDADYDAPMPNCPNIDGTVTSSLSDNLTAHFVWTGSGPPPSPASFLVSDSVSASAGVSYENSGLTSGLSSNATASMGRLSVSAVSPSSGPEDYHEQSGAELKQCVPDANNMVTISVPATETGMASNSINDGVWKDEQDSGWYYEVTNGPTIAYTSASADGVAAPDNRTLTISADVDATWWKKRADGGYVDENGDPVNARVQHAPEADGTMRGDIGIGYGDGTSNVPSNYTSITYHANLAGDWNVANSEYSWYSSLKQSGDSGTLASPSDTIPDFTNLYLQALDVPPVTDGGLPTVNPGDTGNTDHIHLTYIDGSDGASETANYYMTLHQPEEFTQSNKHSVLQSGLPEDLYYQDVSVSPDNPGYALSGAGIHCTWNAPGAYWDWASSGLTVLGAVTPFPWLNAFLTAAGIGLDKLTPQADNGTPSFDSAWDYPDSTFPPSHPKGSAPKSVYNMVPLLHAVYKMHYTLKDDYDLGGYEGTTMISSSEYIKNAGQWYGNFVYAPPDNP